MRSRPESEKYRIILGLSILSHPAISTSVEVSPMTHLMENSSATRMMSAKANPTRRAFFCCSSGSLLLCIEMNTMLSMPRTMSRRVSVKKAIQLCGSVIDSIMLLLRVCLLEVRDSKLPLDYVRCLSDIAYQVQQKWQFCFRRRCVFC